MNNKGFIATSLIYSFFLIFITLFLTIIADYLQNKVLLNTIEGGIKDTINTTKSIEDFDVGDIINVSIPGNEEGIGDIYGIPNSSNWIVASINFDNKNTPSDDSKLILYKTTPDLTDTTNAVTVDVIKTDLKSNGNYNNTRISELILSTDTNYIIPYSATSYIISKTCSKVKINESNNDLIDIDSKGSCDADPVSDTIYRERKEIVEWNDKKVQVNPDSMGGFTITGVA